MILIIEMFLILQLTSIRYPIPISPYILRNTFLLITESEVRMSYVGPSNFIAIIIQRLLKSLSTCYSNVLLTEFGHGAQFLSKPAMENDDNNDLFCNVPQWFM